MKDCCQDYQNSVYVIESGKIKFRVCGVCGSRHYELELPVLRHNLTIGALGEKAQETHES